MADLATRGTLGALADTVEVDTGNDTAFQATVTGTFVGTITFQIIRDSTEGWISAPLIYTAAGAAGSSTLSAPGTRFIGTAGTFGVRAAMTAYTSGSASVTLVGTPGINVSAASGGGGGGAVTVADGADIALGTTTDAGIITDTSGTAIGFLRGNILQWITSFTRLGSLTETAPASDTASSGLNGRLQRIAQRLTTLIGTDLLTQGDVAHGSADSGNPNKNGYVAIAHGANPTAVAAAQRTNAYANRAGVPFWIGGHPNVKTISSNFTTAQTDTAIVTVATGLKIVVTSCLITTANSNTVDVSARLGFGTANTPAYGSNGLLLTDPGIAHGSGVGRGNGAGIIGVGADDEDVRFTCSVPTSGSVDVTVSYYTVES